ncbi:hypothetical protein FRC10_000172 [Ceratobasidium sp. 414]|nr:hypothetical protein FRC10_000172 [Ceratobasidium sp. 414]
MSSHDPFSSLLHPPTPLSRATRPRLSRGISSRKPQPPPVPPSLRDHPLLDVVSTSTASSSTGSSSGNTPIAPASHSRCSSLPASSPLSRSTDKIPLPSPTGLWTLPPRPSPPIAGPWSAPTQCEPEPVRDAMGLLDTVPAGSTVSAAGSDGYPWHAQGRARAQGYDYMSIQHHAPGRAHPHSHSHSHSQPHAHAQPRVPTSPRRQRQSHPAGTLHTHSPRPSPPVTPATA